MFSKRQVLLLDSAKPSGRVVCQLPASRDIDVRVDVVWSVQDGSSMRLMAPLMQAEERWTMKE